MLKKKMNATIHFDPNLKTWYFQILKVILVPTTACFYFARIGWYLWVVFNNAQEILVINTVNSLLQLKTFMLCDDTKYKYRQS